MTVLVEWVDVDGRPRDTWTKTRATTWQGIVRAAINAVRIDSFFGNGQTLIGYSDDAVARHINRVNGNAI